MPRFSSQESTVLLEVAERVTAWQPKNRKLRNLHSRKPFRCCDCARYFGTEYDARRHWRDSHGRKA